MESLGWMAKDKKGRKMEVSEEDPDAVQQAHVHAVTGIMLAIGIKYAGTADVKAKKFLMDHVKVFMKAKLSAPDPCLGKPLTQ